MKDWLIYNWKNFSFISLMHKSSSSRPKCVLIQSGGSILCSSVSLEMSQCLHRDSHQKKKMLVLIECCQAYQPRPKLPISGRAVFGSSEGYNQIKISSTLKTDWFRRKQELFWSQVSSQKIKLQAKILLSNQSRILRLSTSPEGNTLFLILLSLF